MEPIDLPVRGALRKVIVRPERNGFVYVMDRMTGEVLSADPYGYNNSIVRIDLNTGQPVYNPTYLPHSGRTTRGICPASTGAKAGITTRTS